MRRGLRVRGLALFPVLALHFETSLPRQEDSKVKVENFRHGGKYNQMGENA